MKREQQKIYAIVKQENGQSYTSMVIEDGFIYFYDCDGISPSKLSNKYCWFKARKVKYHIIPD